MYDTITITREVTPSGCKQFKVQCGDRWEDELQFDEALGVIAGWLINGPTQLPYLKDPSQHKAFDDQLAQMRADRAEE